MPCIRGGMADLFDRDGTTVYSFLFGKGLTFRAANGETYRVYRPGFAIFPTGSGARTGRMPQTIVAAINRLLTGEARGGSRLTQAQRNRLPGLNSGLPPVPGQPIPGPVIVSGAGEVPGAGRAEREKHGGPQKEVAKKILLDDKRREKSAAPPGSFFLFCAAAESGTHRTSARP